MTDGLLYDKLVVLNDVYRNTLPLPLLNTTSYPKIKTPLYPHQTSLVNGMHTYRDKMIRGFVVGNQAINGKIGIVGDPSGTGKTLSILAYLASQPTLFPRMTCELTNHSSTYFFSHEMVTLSEHSTNLIIVPHSLFGQWRHEIEKHTTMNYVPIETRRMIKGDTLTQEIISSQFVLTTNKCYRYIQEYATEHHIQWNHIIIDEASSIYLHSSDPPLSFQFMWLIATNWIPLLCKTAVIIKSHLFYLRDRVHMHPEFEQWLLDDITKHYEGNIVSSIFLRNYLPFYHPLRGYMVVRNSKETLRMSMNIPPVYMEYISCRPHMNLHSLSHYYQNKHMPPMIHSQNIPYLFQSLGISFKDLDQYLLQHPTKQQIILRKIKDNECMICLEICEYPTIVNCCYQLYCGKCLLTNTLLYPKCPTCRESLGPANMCCMTSLADNQIIQTKTKMEVCLEILQQNREKQIIIYSSFDNIYYQLFEEMDKLGLKVERIENNLFSLRRTIKNYKQGTTHIIFISNVEMIRGLSLESTSHLIFYHELPVSEWKEVLIHSAQRLGRVTPLQILHLNSEIQV
jgi:hypothetical protein